MSENHDGFGKMILGIFLLMWLHMSSITVTAILTSLLQPIFSNIYPLVIFATFCIGGFQLLYVIPTIIILYKQQKWGVMKGVIVGAIITFLLNGGCWLLLLSAYQR
jgi:hypothetical protein